MKNTDSRKTRATLADWLKRTGAPAQTNVNGTDAVVIGPARLSADDEWDMFHLHDYTVTAYTGGSYWLYPAITHVTSLVHEDTVFATLYSYGPRAKAIRAVRERLRTCGACVEAIIRHNGEIVAYLKNNWRGELETVEIHVHKPVDPAVGYGICLVTNINPTWSRFDEAV